MEQIKNAIKLLQDSVVQLETAVHSSKKIKMDAHDKIDELNGVIRQTYQRIDNALNQVNQGSE